MSDTDNPAPPAPVPVATDNTPAEDPSETSEQNDKAPEATPAVEEKDTAEVKATDNAEEQLLAGKFKTPEDMAKAYNELESKLGQTTSEKAELARLNESLIAPTPPAGAGTEEYDDFDQPNSVNPEIDDLSRKVAVQTFIMSHDDANAASMQEVLTTDPLVQSITSHEAKLEYAYLKSQGMSHNKAIAEAEKKGANETVAKIAEKQAAQVETAQKAEPVGENSLLERATGNYSAEDRAAARQELIRKQLVDLR